MTFTLWSRGRLLGESALDYACPIPLVRAGDLRVTELGLRLLTRITDARGDGLLAARALEREGGADRGSDAERTLLLEVCADLAASADYHRALELELRRSDGSVVSTERIDINDVEFLRAFGALDGEDDDPVAGLESEDDEDDGTGSDSAWTEENDLFDDLPLLPELGDAGGSPPDSEPARFQLMVTLPDEGAFP